MSLLSLENGDLIDPHKIDCIRMFGDKKHLKMSSGEVFEITDDDLEYIKRSLSKDLKANDAKRTSLESMASSLQYIENFLHRYKKKNGI